MREVKVTFPDGERMLVPDSWEVDGPGPPRPIFILPGWSFVHTVGGKVIAIRGDLFSGQ